MLTNVVFVSLLTAFKTVRLTGNTAPVDSECFEMISKAFVYSEGSTIYDAMLNQVGIKKPA